MWTDSPGSWCFTPTVCTRQESDALIKWTLGEDVTARRKQSGDLNVGWWIKKYYYGSGVLRALEPVGLSPTLVLPSFCPTVSQNE